VHEEYACPSESYCSFGEAAPHVPMTVIPDSARKYVQLDRKSSNELRAWNAWRKGREVLPCGICDNHKQKEPK